MKKLALIAASFSALFTAATQASELTIDIGGDAFSTEFVTTELGRNSEFSIGVIATDYDTNVYTAKGLAVGNVEGIKGFDAALGVKGYYLGVPGDDKFGFGLGGELSYRLPATPRAQIEAHFYYAPGITFSDNIDYITDFSVRGSYQLLKNGEVYVGYRNLEANFEGGATGELNEGLNIGFRFLF